MAAKAKAAEPVLLEIDGIPTVAGLAKESRTLAYIRPDGKWHVTLAGHERMNQSLRQRARDDLEKGITHGVNGKRYDADGRVL